MRSSNVSGATSASEATARARATRTSTLFIIPVPRELPPDAGQYIGNTGPSKRFPMFFNESPNNIKVGKFGGYRLSLLSFREELYLDSPVHFRDPHRRGDGHRPAPRPDCGDPVPWGASVSRGYPACGDQRLYSRLRSPDTLRYPFAQRGCGDQARADGSSLHVYSGGIDCPVNTLVPALSEPKQRVGRRMPPEGGEKCLANVHYSITKLSGEPSGSLASCSERKGEGRHASMGHHRATLARAPLTAAFCLPEP